MTEFSYSAGIHALVSSMAIAFRDSGCLENSPENPSDVFRAIMNLDEDVRSALDTIFSLDLRLEPNYESFDSFHEYAVTGEWTESQLADVPPIEILGDFEDEDIHLRRDQILRRVHLARHPQLVAHYSPLGSPDYILDFKSVRGRKDSYVALEVWSASFQWFRIMEYGLKKGRLIARLAITPTSEPSIITGPKPWTFNALDSEAFEYVVTEAIHASQQFKACDSCNEVINKLSFSGSRTCDFCAGIIH